MTEHNMNEQPQSQKHYFIEPLREAIALGDPMKIKEELERQPVNAVTEAMSNRLIVRSFLLMQKQRLSQLDGEISINISKPDMMIKSVSSYLNSLDIDFDNSFSGSENGEKSNKLSGDDYLRGILSQTNEVSTHLGRQLVELDVARLTPPESVLAWMQNIRESIVQSMWESVQDVRERAADEVSLRSVHQAVTSVIDDLDKYIAGSLPRSQNVS